MLALECRIRNWNLRPPIRLFGRRMNWKRKQRSSTARHQLHLRGPPTNSEPAPSVLGGIHPYLSSRRPPAGASVRGRRGVSCAHLGGRSDGRRQRPVRGRRGVSCAHLGGATAGGGGPVRGRWRSLARA
jgi:hypothetical protein